MLWPTPLLVGICVFAVTAVVCSIPLRSGFPKVAIAAHAISRGLFACEFFAATMYFLPQQKRILEDFGVRLNPAAIAVITISDYIVMYWYLLAPMTAGVFVADVLIFRRLSLRGDSQRLARYWSATGSTVGLLSIIIATAAIVLPLYALVESLSWRQIETFVSGRWFV